MSWGVSKRLRKILGFSEDMNDEGERKMVGSVWKIPSENPYTKPPVEPIVLHTRGMTDEQIEEAAKNYWQKQDAERRSRGGSGESAIPQVDQGVGERLKNEKEKFIKRWGQDNG